MNDATQKYLDYVRRTGNTAGAEDFVDLREVDFEEVSRILDMKLETVYFDKPIPQELAYVMAAGYDVVSWSPGAAGEGIHATQVHIVLPIAGIENAKLVLRLKSAVACDQLIRILQEHRDFVWGKA
jgi:hypothetical protein